MDRVIRSIALVILVSLAAASANSNAAVPPPASASLTLNRRLDARAMRRAADVIARLHAGPATGAARAGAERTGGASLRLASGELIVVGIVDAGLLPQLRAQKLAADGTPQWGPIGALVASPLDDSSQPVFITDGAGGAIVAWDDPRSGEYDIYAQRIDASGNPMWATNGSLVCGAAFDQQQPRIVSDGADGAIVAWTDVRDGVQSDVFAQKLDAAGAAQWSANGVPVCVQSAMQFGAEMIADGSGGAIVGWLDDRNATRDIYAQRMDSSGNALWTASGVGVCTTPVMQWDLRLVPGGSSGAIFVWTDGDNAYDVRAQRLDLFGAASWPAAGVLVAGGTGDQYLADADADGLGGAVVAWSDYAGLPVTVGAQRIDSLGVLHWGANGVVVNSVDGGYNASIASDGSGSAFVTWEDRRGLNDIYAQRLDASGSPLWAANGVAVCTAPATQGYPAVSFDGSGGALVAWQDDRSMMDNDVYAQRLDTNGAPQWKANGVGALVCPGLQISPSAAALGGGHTLVAWQEKWNGVYHVRSCVIDSLGTPVAPTLTLSADTTITHILPRAASDGLGGGVVAWHVWDESVGDLNVLASHVSAGGALGWTTGGVRACATPGFQWLQALTPDAGGGAIALWTTFASGTWDMFAQHFDAAGAVQWGANGVAVHSGTSIDLEPGAIPDGAGGAIVAWADLVPGSTPRAHAQRLDAAGALQWGVDGVALCSDTLGQTGVRLTSDGAVGGNGAIVAWVDARAGATDIYAQHILSTGALAWPSSGMPVCTAPGFQQDIALVPSSHFSAVIAWSDYRAVGLIGLYAQRIGPDGSAAWSTNGVLVGADANTYFASASMVPDGLNGAFITWHDWRNGYGNADVLAQRLLYNGSVFWDAGGTLVCGAPHTQVDPIAVSDGGAGMVVVWSDCRDGEKSVIFEQRLSPLGAALWSAGGQTPVAFALRLATVIDGRVRIEWAVAEPPAEIATVERRVAPSEEWVAIGTARGDGVGTFAFEDADAPAGAHVGYRLVFASVDGARISPAAWLDVPASVRFAVAIAGAQPVTGALDVAVRLGAAGAVRLELVDLAGRRVLARAASLPAAGGTLRLADATQLRAGVYWLRASGAGASASRKVCVMR